MKFFNCRPYSWYFGCLYVFVLFLFPARISAQQQDFRGFYSVSVDHELFNVLDLSVAPEVRLMNNQTEVETWLIDADVSASAYDWLRLGGLYRFQVDVSDPRKNDIIHRFGLFARFDYRIKPIDFYYRCSYQQEYENMNSSENGMVPKVFLRNKIKATFDKKKIDFKPFAAFEYYNYFKPEKISGVQKSRLVFGTGYKINKTWDVTVSYVLQREIYKNDPLTSHIIALNLGVDWK